MKKVAFIGCSAKKSSRPGRAAKVYLGDLFRLSIRYCKKEGFDKVLILSAKYGVLELDEIISPYDETLNDKSKEERMEWALVVEKQLRNKGVRKYERYYFCGKSYHEFLKHGKTPFSAFKGIGYIKQWLSNSTKKRGLF